MVNSTIEFKHRVCQTEMVSEMENHKGMEEDRESPGGGGT